MPCRPQQLELVVELAGRRRACLLSRKATPFLPFHRTQVLGQSVERQHSVLSALGEGTEKRRRNSKAGRAVSSAALPGSTHRSSSAADGKLRNWQRIHKTRAAVRVVSVSKSKTYKKQETRVCGHQALWHASAASAASRPTVPSVCGGYLTSSPSSSTNNLCPAVSWGCRCWGQARQQPGVVKRTRTLVAKCRRWALWVFPGKGGDWLWQFQESWGKARDGLGLGTLQKSKGFGSNGEKKGCAEMNVLSV